MANEEVLGPRKTMFVLVIVVGCFAVLWPRILSPLILGQSRDQLKPNQFDRDAGCCEVIFETEMAVLELINEVCNSAAHADGKLSPHAAAECRKTVNETCGLDIAAFLKRTDNVGKTSKMLLNTMKKSNSSCLKEHFGVPVWSLSTHQPLNPWTWQDTLKQERPLRGAGPHPALQERGRAIPAGVPAPSPRPITMPPHVRPPPIPGMRPPLGSPGGPAPTPKSSMGFVMPIYTICIIVFFVYTLSKILFNRTGTTPYEAVSPDPQFRRRVFRDDSRTSPDKLVVTAISGLVAEVQQQMEASYAQNQQRQDVQDNNARPYTNGTILHNSGPVHIVASEFKESLKENSPQLETVKETSPEPIESIPEPKEQTPEPQEAVSEENNEVSALDAEEPILQPEESTGEPLQEVSELVEESSIKPEESKEALRDLESTQDRSIPEPQKPEICATESKDDQLELELEETSKSPLTLEESPVDVQESSLETIEGSEKPTIDEAEDLFTIEKEIKQDILLEALKDDTNDRDLPKENLEVEKNGDVVTKSTEEFLKKEAEALEDETADLANEEAEVLQKEIADIPEKKESQKEAENLEVEQETLKKEETKATAKEEPDIPVKEGVNALQDEEREVLQKEEKQSTPELLEEAIKDEDLEVNDEEQEKGSVKVVGMELTAHAADGGAWAPPQPTVLPTPTATPTRPHEAEQVQSIFLETAIPQQSRILVERCEPPARPPHAQSPMVVSGKMTLSLIQDAPRDTPERDPESTVDEFTTASAITQPAEKEDESEEEIEEEIEVEEIEEEVEVEEDEEEEEPKVEERKKVEKGPE